MSDCVLKTLACRGLRVGSSKFWGLKTTNGEFGFQEPKTAQMSAKQGKTKKTTIGFVPEIGLKLDQR